MDLGSLTFSVLATALGVGTSSGVRAVQPLLLLAALGRFGLVTLPSHLRMLQSTPALGALVALLLIEEVLERDDDMQELLAAFKYGVHGTGGAVVGYLLIEKFHLPLDGWPVTAIAVVISLLTHGLRMQVHDALRDVELGFFSPREWLSWLETGGALGVMVAVLLAPILVLVIVAVAAVASVVIALLAKSVERSRRRACPVCGAFIRKEASVCPHCKEEVSPSKWLSKGSLGRLEIDGVVPGKQLVDAVVPKLKRARK